MDLSRIAVALRPRTAWEGVDLGFAMARSWYTRLWTLWMCSAVPVYLAALALLPESDWLLPTMIVWWCKPLYEPPLLYWASRAMFGEPPGWSDMRRRWWRSVRPGLVANLTWRRFNPFRSFHMAVAVLEGLQGRQRRDRILVLGRDQHAAGWLTLVGLAFEFVLQISFIVLAVLMIPEELRWTDEWSLAFGTGDFPVMVGEIGAMLAMSVMAPFYVSAGFSLYMNRRSSLEGWDIDLGFRRIVAARRRRSATRGAATAALMLACVVGPGLEDLQAGEPPAPDEARAVIGSVLDHPDFGRREVDTYWKFVGDGDGSGRDAGWLGEWVGWLVDVAAGFYKGVAAVGEVLLWIAVGLALAWVAARALTGRRPMTAPRPGSRRSPPADTRLVDLDLAPESLPADIPSAAAALLERGDPRGALSLLYRGMLSRFVHRARLSISDSATEGECLALVERERPSAEVGYFGRLTREWIRLAYAHRLPDGENVRVLCSQWREVNDDTVG